MAWDVGEKQRLTATFTPAASEDDPTMPVMVTIKAPDGTLLVEDEQAIEKSPTEFYYDFIAVGAGVHAYAFESADKVIQQGSFRVIAYNTK